MTSKSDPAEDDDLKDLQEMMDGHTREGGTGLFLDLLASQVEEMFEAARAKYPQYLPAKEEASQHAWGKPRLEGSLDLPSGFEGVTSLGPVILMCPPKGVHLPRLGTPHATTAVVYQDGFAYQAGGREVKTWRYEEVAAIQTKLEDHSPTYVHEFTLYRTNGEKLILDDIIHISPVAVAYIKLTVFKRLVDPTVQRYEAGEALAFGPVTVHKQNGLTLNGHHYAWGDIQNVEVQFGEFKLLLSKDKKQSIHTSEIPNLELLGHLIGLDPAEVNMGQEFISNTHY
ncbi:MAG TPA: DUF6585 family protein [Anaerolineales bacterium]|nr:DUF6585 family protein [Anaerolineales bacterium]